MKPCPSLFYLCGPYFVVLTSVRRCWSLILTGPDIYYSTKGSYFFFAFFVFLFCFCFFTCLLQAGTYLSVRTLSPSLKKNKGLDGIRTHTSQILINRDHIISQSMGIILISKYFTKSDVWKEKYTFIFKWKLCNSTEIRFQSFKIPFKFTFHGFFPLHKIIFFEVGLFFIQWMLKINIPTSPLPLWEYVVRSKKDIFLSHLNHLQTVCCQN